MNSDIIFRRFDKATDIAQAVSEVIEEDEFVGCERCGEETSPRLVGDEYYAYCQDCNWVTN